MLSIQRHPDRPIITPTSGAIGDNINGPALMRVPNWVDAPLDHYYCYFAHHHGDGIRLATAAHPTGPWTVRPGRVLYLDQVTALGFHGHIASPDILIDDANQRILLFFHGPRRGWDLATTPSLRTHGSQSTALAVSSDGLTFAPVPGPVLGFPYFRVFMHRGRAYALAVRGLLFRCPTPGIPDGSQPWEERAEPLTTWRHCAVMVEDDRLIIAFTRAGDAPERILWAEMNTADDWQQWQLGEVHELLRPERDWEGADLPITPSRTGAAPGREHALRDPGFLRDGDATWLCYAIAGESGLAMARLSPQSLNTDDAAEPAPETNT